MITKLDHLGIELPGLAGAVQKLLENGTTFAALGPDPFPPLALEGTATVPVRDGQFVLGGAAKTHLQLSVLKGPGSNQDDDQILQVTEGRAWLKHKVEAQVQGSLGGPLGDSGATFGLTGGVMASLTQYRAHALTEPVGQAVIDDVTSFRLPLRLDDVRSLREGDVLACTVHGKLGLSVQLTLADVLSAAMAALDEELGAVGVAVVMLREGLSVGVSLSVEDDYRLVFRAGSRSGTTRVELRKTRGQTTSGSVGLSLKAELAAFQPLRLALDAYLRSRLGPPLSELESLIQRVNSVADFEALNSVERALAEKVAGRLGLTDLRKQWHELTARLNGLIARLTAKLRDTATLKIAADAALAYTRIATEETILACELDGAALADRHCELLLGNFTGLLANLAAGASGYGLIEYLKQAQFRKELSFGLSLSIGSWAASGVDKVVKEWKEQAHLDGGQRWSFTGQQIYTGTWGGAATQYAFGLGAAMEGFSAAPQAGEFKYSLSFGWNWNEALTPALLSDALDLANVWGISHQRENDDHQNAILGQASGPVRIEVEVQVSDAGVRSLLEVPADGFEGAWIEAMAAALPRVRFGSRIYRTRVGDRIRAYLEAAGFAFEQSAQGGADIAAIAGRIHYQEDDPDNLNQLRQIDQGTLAFGDFPDLGLPVLWTATTIDDRPARRCRRARAALDGLAEAIRGHLDPKQVEKAFDDLQRLISRPYEHRVLGRVVANLVKARRPGALITKLKVTAADGTVLLI